MSSAKRAKMPAGELTMTRHHKLDWGQVRSESEKVVEEVIEDDDVRASLQRSDPLLDSLEISVAAFCASIM